jgi:hypothetical protein
MGFRSWLFMNSPRPKATINAALKPALRLMREYVGDGRHHIPVTAWDLRMARRLMNVRTDKHGWIARDWDAFLREVGLDPETMEEIDPFRWQVALEIIHDPTFENTFPIKQFRERLILAREAAANGQEPPSEDEPSSRRVFLENLGFELD